MLSHALNRIVRYALPALMLSLALSILAAPDLPTSAAPPKSNVQTFKRSNVQT